MQRLSDFAKLCCKWHIIVIQNVAEDSNRKPSNWSWCIYAMHSRTFLQPDLYISSGYQVNSKLITNFTALFHEIRLSSSFPLSQNIEQLIWAFSLMFFWGNCITLLLAYQINIVFTEYITIYNKVKSSVNSISLKSHDNKHAVGALSVICLHNTSYNTPHHAVYYHTLSSILSFKDSNSAHTSSVTWQLSRVTCNVSCYL